MDISLLNVQVTQDLLVHELGLAVGVGGGEGEVLSDRHGSGIAVNSGGGGEDDLFHPVLLHGFAEGESGIQIVAVITERLGNAFTDGLETRKMNHRVDLGVIIEHIAEFLHIKKITLNELRTLPCNFLYSVKNTNLTVAKIINDDCFVSTID